MTRGLPGRAPTELELVGRILRRGRAARPADHDRAVDIWVRESRRPSPDDLYYSLVKGRNVHLIVRQNGEIDEISSGRIRTGLWYRHLRHLSYVHARVDARPLAPTFRKQVRGLGYLYRAFDGLERVDVAHATKGGVALWFASPRPRSLDLEFRIAHDEMWPSAPVPRTYRLRTRDTTYRVSSDLTETRFTTDGAAEVRLEGDRLTIRLAGMRHARLYISADRSAWFPGDLARTLSAHAAVLEGPRLETPHFRLNKLFVWAQHDLDELFSDSDVGPGYYAGFPCFSWYFGRDGEWTSFAAIATGRADQAAAHLETLRRHADHGRLPHEIVLTPDPRTAADRSGPLGLSTDTRYMSIDTNPLWALAQIRLARWTGRPLDVQGVREALDFTRSLDTDGDGLIENDFSRRLIGWTESWADRRDGACIDANAWWLAAITEYARATGDDRYDASRVRGRFLSTFFPRGPAGPRVLDSIDGTTERETRTPAQIVPAIYDDDERMRAVLPGLSGPDLVTPWGVRALSTSDPMFDGGYHTGTVWPLMTGWFVLAAYRQGLAPAALRELLTFPLLAFDGPDPGRVSEAYHPEHPTPTGQFAQGWSSALFLSSVVEGLFGLSPSGRPGAAGLAERARPHLPPDWPRMALVGLPYHGRSYTVTVDRTGTTVRPSTLAGPRGGRAKEERTAAALARAAAPGGLG